LLYVTPSLPLSLTQAVRASEREVQEVLRTRAREELAISLEARPADEPLHCGLVSAWALAVPAAVCWCWPWRRRRSGRLNFGMRGIPPTAQRHTPNPTLQVAYYNVTHTAGESSDGEGDEGGASAEAALDYLAPYWPQGAGPALACREQALEVHQRCLRALKDRLIERATIIQVRPAGCGL
jgi:hypothetical protein